VSDITSGKRLTLAQWMRSYVNKHPDYKHDSILPKKTMDDLLLTLNEISKGTIKDENFYQIF
jgi:glutamate--cysteine ligase catalytic subunit